jgi:ElaA protein
MQLHWTYQSFAALSNTALYAILQLRNEVFVVEQNCVYQDADNKDQDAFHLSGWDGETLAASCRILPPGKAFEDASIGRVLIHIDYRKTGIGRQLMHLAIEKTLAQYHCTCITISAQQYLTNFYQSLGFVPTSTMYLEDGIPHLKMQYRTKK